MPGDAPGPRCALLVVRPWEEGPRCRCWAATPAVKLTAAPAYTIPPCSLQDNTEYRVKVEGYSGSWVLATNTLLIKTPQTTCAATLWLGGGAAPAVVPACPPVPLVACPHALQACSPASLATTSPLPRDCRAPVIAAADATGTTTASITVNPPEGATVTSYTVKLCLVSSPATCVPSVTYPTNIVPFEGLTAGAAYTGGCRHATQAVLV